MERRWGVDWIIMAQDIALIQVIIGEAPANPGIQYKMEFVVGGNDYEGEVAAVTQYIGEFDPMKFYFVLNTISSEAATELASFLHSAWVGLSSGEVTDSALVTLIPLLRPDPTAPDKLALSFSSHNQNVIVTVKANDQINTQAQAGLERAGSGEIYEQEHGFWFDLESSASVSSLLASDNPLIELLTNFKARTQLKIKANSLETLDAALVANGVPPQIIEYLQVLKITSLLDFGVTLRSPSELPNDIRKLVQSSEGHAREIYSAVQQIPPRDREVLDKLAESMTGIVEIFAHAKTLFRGTFIARGASEVLKAN
jgi:hypothetical protein